MSRAPKGFGPRADRHRYNNEFLSAEASFLKATGHPMVKKSRESKLKTKKVNDTQRALEAVSKMNTVEFFEYLMDEATEKKLWMIFITGQAPRLGPDGVQIVENGVPQFDKVELNPVSWAAFKRAVEYKRGMPLVTVNSKGGALKTVEVITIGGFKEPPSGIKEARELLGGAV